MARQCQLTGKKTATGNNRPFSMKATRRTFRVNLFTKTMYNPNTGKVEKMKLSAAAIRTLKKWAKENGKEAQSEVAARAAAQEGQKKRSNEEKGRVHKVKLTPKQKKEMAAAEEAAKLGKTDSKVEDMKKEAEEKKEA